MAHGIRTARFDLLRPEVLSRLVALTVEKVVVVVTDKGARIVNGISGVFGQVISDLEWGRSGHADSAALWVLKNPCGKLQTFRVVVIIDQNFKGLFSLAGGKDQPASYQCVVAFLLRRVVLAGYLNSCGCGGRT